MCKQTVLLQLLVERSSSVKLEGVALIVKSKILLITFAALCVVLGLLLLQSNHVLLHSRQRPLDFSEKPLSEQAKELEVEGVMYKSEYIKEEQLWKSIQESGTISDADLAWVIHMLEIPGPKKDTLPREIRRGRFFGLLKEVKNYTPSQKEVVFQTMTTYVTNSNRIDKLWSVAVFRHLKDTRAIAFITPLLNDSDPAVRRESARTVKVINSQ